jgi:hypothetical protein
MQGDGCVQFVAPAAVLDHRFVPLFQCLLLTAGSTDRRDFEWTTALELILLLRSFVLSF